MDKHGYPSLRCADQDTGVGTDTKSDSGSKSQRQQPAAGRGAYPSLPPEERHSPPPAAYAPPRPPTVAPQQQVMPMWHGGGYAAPHYQGMMVPPGYGHPAPFPHHPGPYQPAAASEDLMRRFQALNTSTQHPSNEPAPSYGPTGPGPAYGHPTEPLKGHQSGTAEGYSSSSSATPSATTTVTEMHNTPSESQPVPAEAQAAGTAREGFHSQRATTPPTLSVPAAQLPGQAEGAMYPTLSPRRRSLDEDASVASEHPHSDHPSDSKRVRGKGQPLPHSSEEEEAGGGEDSDAASLSSEEKEETRATAPVGPEAEEEERRRIAQCLRDIQAKERAIYLALTGQSARQIANKKRLAAERERRQEVRQHHGSLLRRSVAITEYVTL